MSSISMNATALAAALGAPPLQPLTLVWKALVIPALRGARVLDLVEGKDEAPDEFIEEEDSHKQRVSVVNPAYETWIARDQLVLR
jgi:hypothetical protein